MPHCSKPTDGKAMANHADGTVNEIPLMTESLLGSAEDATDQVLTAIHYGVRRIYTTATSYLEENRDLEASADERDKMHPQNAAFCVGEVLKGFHSIMLRLRTTDYGGKLKLAYVMGRLLSLVIETHKLWLAGQISHNTKPSPKINNTGGVPDTFPTRDYAEENAILQDAIAESCAIVRQSSLRASGAVVQCVSKEVEFILTAFNNETGFQAIVPVHLIWIQTLRDLIPKFMRSWIAVMDQDKSTREITILYANYAVSVLFRTRADTEGYVQWEKGGGCGNG